MMFLDMPIRPSSFIDILRQERTRLGMSQEDVARAVKISLRNYQRIESAEVSPRLDVLFRIIKVIGIDARKVLLDAFHGGLRDQVPESIEKLEREGWRDASRTKPMLIDNIEIEGLKKALTNEYERGHEDVGYWEWNIDTKEFYWSTQMFHVYKMDPTEDFNHAAFIATLDPEDVKAMNMSIENLVEKDIPYTTVHKVTTDGEIFRVRALARLYRNQAGHRIIFGIAERVDSK